MCKWIKKYLCCLEEKEEETIEPYNWYPYLESNLL
jgi:hypothetical protein